MDQAVSESKKAARKSAKAMDDTTTKPADRGAKATPAAAPAAQPAWQPLADLAHVLRANWIPVTVGVLALAAGGWAFYGPEIQAFAAVQLNAAATQIVKVGHQPAASPLPLMVTCSSLQMQLTTSCCLRHATRGRASWRR